MVDNATINPARLVSLRRKLKKNQKQLAGDIGVDVGTVSRWERGAVTAIRSQALGKLAEALKTTADVLCGDGPLPECPSVKMGSSKDQMNMMINGSCRNALAFVAKRYGLTRQQIVEAAPLLFFIAAEQSLLERREKLDGLLDKLYEAGKACPSYLHSDRWDDAQDDRSVVAERESIAARDIFGIKSELDVNDEEVENPFAHFLTEQLKRAQDPKRAKNPPRSVQWYVGDSPRYFVCTEDISAYVGNDEKAMKLIQEGLVTLHDMPTEVRKSSGPKRAEWIRERWREVSEAEEPFSFNLDKFTKGMEASSDTEDDL